MKATELITELEKIIAEKGDLLVAHRDWRDELNVIDFAQIEDGPEIESPFIQLL